MMIDGEIKEDFMRHVRVSENCWEWVGGKVGIGYGRFRRNGKTVRAHRASYEMYKGAIPPGFLVRHTCDNPGCVNPNHLLVGTTQDNSRDMVERGRSMRGEKHHSIRVTEDQVREIRRLSAAGYSQAQLDTMFPVNQATIYEIVHYKLWAHIQDDPENPRVWSPPGRTRGTRVNTAILNENQVRAIRKAHAEGAWQADLKRQYGVSKNVIYDVIHRITWKHVTNE